MKIRLCELRVLLEVLLDDKLLAVLHKIEQGDYHMLPSENFSPKERAAVKALQARKFIRFKEADHRMPDRFVLTTTGSHAIDTFKFTTM